MMARATERRGFQYQARSREDIKERANASGGDFDSIFKPQYKTYKLKDGKNIIRILPPTWPGAKHYGYDIFVNYGIGADTQSYLSLSKMKQEKDPLAEARREAERDGDEKLSRDLKPRKRSLFWLLDRLEPEEGPQLWACPFTVDKDFANLSFDEDTGEVVLLDEPNEGCDIRFYREGKGLNTDYPASKMKIMKPSPISDDAGAMQEILDYITANPLPDVLNYYSYAHIAAVFNGTPVKGTNGAAPEDEEAPPPKTTARAAAPDPEDDEDPLPKPVTRVRQRPAPEPEEDEEPVAPPARRRAAAVVPPEDDEGDAEPPPRQSIRERLQSRRRPTAAEEE